MAGEKLMLQFPLQIMAWMHISGITPAISESLMKLSIESVKEAKKRNISVSCDLNYRKNLWKYGKNAQEVMSEMAVTVTSLLQMKKMFRNPLELQLMLMLNQAKSTILSMRSLEIRFLKSILTLK